VVTLLAILELARLKVIRVLQAEGDGASDETLFIAQVAGASMEAARRVAVTSADGEASVADEPEPAAEVEPEAKPAETAEETGPNEETQDA